MKLDLNPFRKKKKIHTSITLDQELHELIVKLCKKEKIKVSHFIEALVGEFFGR